MKTPNTIEELQAKIKINDNKRDLLFKEQKKVNDNLSRLFKANVKLENQIADIKSQDAEPDIEYVLFENGSVTGKRFEYRSRALASLGLGHDRYDPKTQQIIPRIYTLSGSDFDFDFDFDKTYDGIKKIFKYLNI